MYTRVSCQHTLPLSSTLVVPRSRNARPHSSRNIYVKSREGDNEPSMEEILEECDDIEAEINVADFESVSVRLIEEQDDEYVMNLISM